MDPKESGMNEIWSLLVAQGVLGIMQTCFQILTNPHTYSVCGHVSDKQYTNV